MDIYLNSRWHMDAAAIRTKQEQHAEIGLDALDGIEQRPDKQCTGLFLDLWAALEDSERDLDLERARSECFRMAYEERGKAIEELLKGGVQ